MSAGIIPALCINLNGATERWTHVQTQALRWLAPLDMPLVRVEAVHWRSLLSTVTARTAQPTTDLLLVPPPDIATVPEGGGTTLMDTMDGVPMTPFTRWLLQGGTVRQRDHRASHRQMDTPSSVGCMLSHIRCWEWLRAHPQHPAALVLEDDVCFDGPAFRAAWDGTVQRLLRMPTGCRARWIPIPPGRQPDFRGRPPRWTCLFSATSERRHRAP